MNLLCLVGVLVGAVASLVPWMRIQSVFNVPPYEPWRAIHDFVPESLLWLSLTLFFVGVVIAVISPFGGFVQAVGGVLFFSHFFPKLDSWDATFEDSLVLGFGPFLGFLSASISIVSIFRPLGIGYSKSFDVLDSVLSIRVIWHPKHPLSFGPWSDRQQVLRVFAALSCFAGAWAIIYGTAAPEMTSYRAIADREALYSVLTAAGIVFLIAGVAIFLSIIASRSGRRMSAGGDSA